MHGCQERSTLRTTPTVLTWACCRLSPCPAVCYWTLPTCQGQAPVRAGACWGLAVLLMASALMSRPAMTSDYTGSRTDGPQSPSKLAMPPAQLLPQTVQRRLLAHQGRPAVHLECQVARAQRPGHSQGQHARCLGPNSLQQVPLHSLHSPMAGMQQQQQEVQLLLPVPLRLACR